MQDLNSNIIINQDGISSIKDFAIQFSKAGKTLSNFGTFGPNITRDEIEQFVNTVNGKIGELAFKEFANKEFNEQIDIDLEVWDGHSNCDGGQDIKTIEGKAPSAIVDIKQSKRKSQWLAVEQHKIDGSISSADVFILVTTENECSFTENTQQIEWPSEVSCLIEGFAFREDFFDREKNPFFKFFQGNRLYRKNFVVHTLSLLDYTFLSSDLQSAIAATKRKFGYDNEKIFLAGELDAHTNIALPKFLLRKSKNDFLNLFIYLHGKESRYKRMQIVAKQ